MLFYKINSQKCHERRVIFVSHHIINFWQIQNFFCTKRHLNEWDPKVYLTHTERQADKYTLSFPLDPYSILAETMLIGGKT